MPDATASLLTRGLSDPTGAALLADGLTGGDGAATVAALLIYTLGPVSTDPGYSTDPAGCDGGPSTLIAGSAQPVFVPVGVTDFETGEAADPTVGGIPWIAFTPGADPEPQDWQQAAWVTRASDSARFAETPAPALTPGSYFAFVRTADGFVGRAPDTLRVR